MFETTILQLGIPGGPEVLLLLLLAVLLFGANKIPKLARSSGQAIGEFQKGREQVEQELEEIQSGSSLDEESDDEFGVSDTEASSDTETSTETN
ncbi:twin-arginine translocation protein, TatA/E family subunit [Halorhabdus utahensis DSM 12940]|uniref:Twin-arginine translocation protein, TatA/E family subunit n=1 Tax=Halorhabdus utahensis (strain DSM 12940 / JCM 11049 / AX-2) TaxID=519442 RepID=C7NQJ5_HALUD|nr:twin-arginine translocase TatA/TatE family subunit [Halorhabdus utahensis]ACV10454.1 twin-arginine translocation protein, TatA/E family subunit [Halorhabdus utahensis DSM 12940]